MLKAKADGKAVHIYGLLSMACMAPTGSPMKRCSLSP